MRRVYYLLAIFAVLLFPGNMQAAALNVGDTFTAGGITYKVTNTSPNEAQVGDGQVPAIDEKSYGHVDIPYEVEGTDGNSYIVKTIGRMAFFGCRYIGSINLYNTSIETIENYAFEGCKDLLAIDFSYCLTTIGESAFMNCQKLFEITFPNTLVTLGFQAFAYCNSLKSVTIPASLKECSNNPFIGCENLESIVVDKDNPCFDSRDGCNAIIRKAIWEFWGNGSITETDHPELIAGCKNTVIPETVTQIREYAFSHIASLTSIVIPHSVTRVGGDAFRNCTNLVSLTLGKSIKDLGRWTFMGCPNLQEVYSYITDPEFIYEENFYKSDEQEVFTDATLYVPTGTKEKYLAADGWNKFKNIIEKGMSAPLIKGETFQVYGITYMVTNNNPLEVQVGSQYAAAIDENWEAPVEIPATVEGSDGNNYAVTSLGDYAFYNCWRVRELILHLDTPPSVPDGAFSSWEFKFVMLRVPQGSVDRYKAANVWNLFGGIAEIGKELLKKEDTFEYDGITYQVDDLPFTVSVGKGWEPACDVNREGDVTIPTTVIGKDGMEYIPVSIAGQAFLGCDKITSVTIPESVESINNQAFNSTAISSIIIPSSVTFIGTSVLAGCRNLTSIVVSPNNTTYDSRDNCNAIIKSDTNELIEGCNATVIPSTVTTIGQSAFSGRNLTTIEISNSITAIGERAFSGCRSATTIILGAAVESIGELAFQGCVNVTEITSYIENPSAIPESAFSSAVYENAILNVPAGTKALYKATDGWMLFNQIVNGEPEQLSVGDTFTAETLEGVEMTFTVTSLDPMECEVSNGNDVCIDKSVTGTVTIPDEVNGYSVTSLNYSYAFRGTNISKLVFGRNLRRFGVIGGPNLSEVEFPKGIEDQRDITTITGGPSLTTITVPKNIWFSNNFTVNYGIQSIYVEEGSEKHTSVDGVVFSKDMTDLEIYPYARQAEEYVIPEGTKRVVYGISCPNLKKLTIPESMEETKNYNFHLGFKGSVDLIEIISYMKEPFNQENLFDNEVYQNATLYVPYGTKANYLATNGWKEFANIKEIDGVTLDPIESETIVDTEKLKNENLTDNMVDGIYYNLGADGYDATDGSIVINEVTSMAKISNSAPGSDDVKNNFTGMIMLVNKGAGIIEANVKTSGDAQLVFQIGNDAPTIVKQDERGDVIIPFDVTEETYFYIYAIHGSSNAAKTRAEQEPLVKIYSITVSPGADMPKFKLTYTVDGKEYKSSEVEYGTSITVEEAPTKEGYTFSGWSEVPKTMPAKDVTITGTFTVNKYKLTYTVDGKEYKTSEVEFGASITAEAAPTKEGYTFSGWSEVPKTMPAKDVTVTGSFTINKYKLTYTVDGKEYKTSEVEFGANITAEAAPTKEGYTFSGWSEIPKTMPAKDVTVTGTFTVNKYKLTYTVDGKEYKASEVEYGASITPEAAPTKEGYTFSGWSEIPKTMPAKDVTITGTFSKGSYKLTYVVDGETYKIVGYDFEASITPEAAPTKEGYTFSGWSDIPKTMPAKDVTVTGTFTINKYKLTYTVDGLEYKTSEVEYGASITAETDPTKEGYTFSGWSEVPKTMPAKDVTVTGSFTINKYKLIYMVDGEEYKTYEVEFGSIITAEAEPTKEGYVFSGWSDVPSTMPAEDVTVTGTFIQTAIGEIRADGDSLRIYDLNGNRLDRTKSGVNIIRQADGKVRKVVVK